MGSGRSVGLGQCSLSGTTVESQSGAWNHVLSMTD